MNFSRVFGSQFPDSVITLNEYKDVGEASADIQTLVNQYYTYMDNKNYASASALLESNWDVLKPYYVGMGFFNRTEEELYNIGLYAKAQNAFTVVSDSEPSESDYPNVMMWLKPIS